MLSPQGIRLVYPSTTIPWYGSADALETAILGPRTIFGRRRRRAVEVRPPGPGSPAWRMTMYSVTLLPGVDGQLMVDGHVAQDRWVTDAAVLTRTSSTRRPVPPSVTDGPVASALATALGPLETTSPAGRDADGLQHSVLVDWHTGVATVRYGIWSEHDARDTWEEVRITRAAPSGSGRVTSGILPG